MTTAHLRAGQLNRVVSIQQRSTTQDSFGGLPESWTEIKQVYALVEALSGYEKMAGEAIASGVSHRITVRYDTIFDDPKVVATYRVVYKNRIFDVQACMDIDEGNHIVELLATEGMTLG
ncbi:phage head closure protein [Burkholderia pseudomallei]|uniref:phage head closure protein n=1 Tax=Burkholderia pseudomallei TaxID=28450 RepID=UPI00190AACDF|nr:phage head closure protein [Burkholderia pseudomallei]MBK3333552.1 phage head closure protein [Burkholderia pseudomallei]